jgi:hypothetical protein
MSVRPICERRGGINQQPNTRSNRITALKRGKVDASGNADVNRRRRARNGLLLTDGAYLPVVYV